MSLFSHLFILFYQYGLTDINFIWEIIIFIVTIYFVGETVPALAIGRLLSSPFNMPPAFVFSTLCHLQDALHSSCVFTASIQNQPFLQGAGFLLL